MERTLPIAAIVTLVVLGLPLFAAVEKWIIPVRAEIALALDVDPHIVDFQTVFAQEVLNRSLNISLSDAFLGEDKVDDVCYNISVEPHGEEGAQDIAKILKLIPDGFDIDERCADLDPDNPYRLSKMDEVTTHIWNATLMVPHILVFDSFGAQLCGDDVTDQSCDEPLDIRLGNFTGKIQIEVSAISPDCEKVPWPQNPRCKPPNDIIIVPPPMG